MKNQSKYEITEFQIDTLTNPSYIKPYLIRYKQDGVIKTWEAVKSHDSVAILLYHKKRDSFLLVKQFRPPVFLNNNKDGFTYELCAGLVDKNKSLQEIAKEEILEECGYDIDINSLQEITSFNTNVGISGAVQTLFFATSRRSLFFFCRLFLFYSFPSNLSIIVAIREFLTISSLSNFTMPIPSILSRLSIHLTKPPLC
jgi:nudix-type nucleoside diphosphatase (YffH/AdpP family)